MNTFSRRTFFTRLAVAAGLTAVTTRVAALPRAKKIDATSFARPEQKPLLVKGVAIKVPSNRVYRCVNDIHIEGQTVPTVVEYIGYWDGTFKMERGCSNPAFVLADLYERTGEIPDWVVSPQTWHRMPTQDQPFGYGAPLNWPMLYDWGKWCDEPATDLMSPNTLPIYQQSVTITWSTRMAVNTICQTRRDMVKLREELRMHCLHWQSLDPRWRKSCPV